MIILILLNSRTKENNLNSIVVIVDIVSTKGQFQSNRKDSNKSFIKPITIAFNYLEVKRFFI